MKATIERLTDGSKAIVVSAQTKEEEDILLKFEDAREVTVDQATTIGIVIPINIKIPKGCAKCPVCQGTGQTRTHFDQFRDCYLCHGRGFVEEDIHRIKREIP